MSVERWEEVCGPWTMKFAAKNLWRIKDAFIDALDLVQDGWILFDELRGRYGHLEPRRFMAIYKVSFHRLFMRACAAGWRQAKAVLAEADCTPPYQEPERVCAELGEPPPHVRRLLEMNAGSARRCLPAAAWTSRGAMNEYLCQRLRIDSRSVDVVALIELYAGVSVRRILPSAR